MSASRLDTLLQFLQESPEDPFVIYALAMEYQKLGETEKTEDYYSQLIEQHPNYVGTYYHFGKLRVAQNKWDDAASLYKAGIAAAQRAGDRHAERELREALLEIEDE